MSIPSWLLLPAYLVVNLFVGNAVWWYWTTERHAGWPSTRLAHFFMCELRPVYIPALLVIIADDSAHHRSALRLFIDCCALLNYFLKDKDDDRWKRRRAKMASKVQQAGSRLIVVPAST